MIDEFKQFISEHLKSSGYQVTDQPNLPGLRGILFAKSSTKIKTGFSKSINYYFFTDWDYDLLRRTDQLKQAYQTLSKVVNQDFKVARGWRMTIPNIVLAVVTTESFDEQAIRYALYEYQSPFIGGEVGQTILFDLQKQDMYSYYPYGYRQPGSIPLGLASGELWNLFHGFMPHGRSIQRQ